MSVVVFSCGNEKCFATVDPATLNDLRLKIIRAGAVLCKSCGERTIWLETSMLIDVEKIKQIPIEMEGKRRARSEKHTH